MSEMTYFGWALKRAVCKTVAYLILGPVFCVLIPFTLLGEELYRAIQILRHVR